MVTLEEIRAELARERAALAREKQASDELNIALVEAAERQRLRRMVDDVKDQIENCRNSNREKRMRRGGIDADACGPHVAIVQGRIKPELPEKFSSGQSEITCRNRIYRGEYTWTISEMSWLRHALTQCQEQYTSIDGLFEVGPECFDFVYNPNGSSVNFHQDKRVCATLAIRHCSEEDGVTFRYKIFIQRNDGEFIQWGQQGDICMPWKEDDSTGYAFGPDVRLSPFGEPMRASGIFDMTHEELLESKWVSNDTLVVKFELEVLDFRSELEDLQAFDKTVKLAPSTINANIFSLFEEGKCSDVTFVVKSEEIKAHSQILAARSEVFEKQLHGGLQESVSKEVAIADCEPAVFRSFLKFLYTDDFSHIKELVARCPAKCSDPVPIGNDGESTPAIMVEGTQISVLQDTLSLSHKYQIPRLSSWCEQQLCNYITNEEVCSVLIQAHLYEAVQLENVCLRYIKENMQTLASTPEFARVSAEWPQILLKISLFSAGVSSNTAVSAVAVQQELLRKRKRDDAD